MTQAHAPAEAPRGNAVEEFLRGRYAGIRSQSVEFRVTSAGEIAVLIVVYYHGNYVAERSAAPQIGEAFRLALAALERRVGKLKAEAATA